MAYTLSKILDWKTNELKINHYTNMIIVKVSAVESKKKICQSHEVDQIPLFFLWCLFYVYRVD